jgi:hypothetical protein
MSPIPVRPSGRDETGIAPSPTTRPAQAAPVPHPHPQQQQQQIRTAPPPKPQQQQPQAPPPVQAAAAAAPRESPFHHHRDREQTPEGPSRVPLRAPPSPQQQPQFDPQATPSGSFAPNRPIPLVVETHSRHVVDLFNTKRYFRIPTRYTATATVMAPDGRVVRGETGIADLWRECGWVELRRRTESVTQDEGDPLTAYETGTYQHAEGTGTYFILWKRRSPQSAKWSIHFEVQHANK